MIDQLKAAFPAVEWQPDAETGGWCGRNRRTWVYVWAEGTRYHCWAELERRGGGVGSMPEEAVRAALVDLEDQTLKWAERVASALRKWGQP